MKKLLAILALSTSAFAGTVTQTLSIGATPLDYSTTLTFNQFDPALGTLVDIKFIIDGTSTDTDGVTNQSGKTATFTYQAKTDFALTDPDGNTTNEEVPSSAKTSKSIANNATFTFSGTAAGISHSTYNAAGNLTFTDGSFNDTPIIIATYVGVGTITFTVDANDSTTLNGGPHTATASGTANETITVIYDYTSPSGTPEPATMLLFGSALVGLGTWKKFGKKSA